MFVHLFDGRGSCALCISSGAGMPACRRRTRYRGHNSGAGMTAGRMWELCSLYLVRRRLAGMPDIGVMPSVSRPAPACRHAGAGRDTEGTTLMSGMQAPDKIQGKRDDLATASGMTAEKKRYLMLKRTIRQAGRQEGQGDERRHGRGHRHDGNSAKKKR